MWEACLCISVTAAVAGLSDKAAMRAMSGSGLKRGVFQNSHSPCAAILVCGMCHCLDAPVLSAAVHAAGSALPH
jgi:hypothetical protein